MANVIRFAADGMLIAIVLVAIGAALVWLRRQTRHHIMDTVPTIVMAGLTSLLVGKLVSLVYQPDSARPFIERGVEAGAAYINNPGFPSDHTLLAVVVVAAIWFVTGYRRLAVMLAVMVAIMSAARVIALVHTPVDIIGGAIAGLSGVVWYMRHRDKP